MGARSRFHTNLTRAMESLNFSMLNLFLYKESFRSITLKLGFMPLFNKNPDFLYKMGTFFT